MINICTYCERETQVRVWKETGELVCYDCRVDFLDREYQNEITQNLFDNLFRKKFTKEDYLENGGDPSLL